jgi:hypothetical protein
MGHADARSARTPACRVHTRVNAWDSVAVGPASSTEPVILERVLPNRDRKGAGDFSKTNTSATEHRSSPAAASDAGWYAG